MGKKKAETADIEWMSTKQTAEYIRVSVRTMKLWRQKDIGPKFHKAGHSVRYFKPEVNYWLAYGKRADEEKSKKKRSR